MIRASRLNDTKPLMAMTVFRPPNLSSSTSRSPRKRPWITFEPVVRRMMTDETTVPNRTPPRLTMASPTRPPPASTTTT